MAQAPQPIGWTVAAELSEIVAPAIATPELDASEPGASETGASGAAAPRRIAVSADLADGARRVVTIDGDRETQTALGRLVSMVWLTPVMDRLWLEGASERRRFLDRAAFALEPQHGLRVAAYEKAMRERNRLLKDLDGARPSAAQSAWLDAIEMRMAEAGHALAATRQETLAALVEAQREAADAGEGAPFPAADLVLAGPYEESGVASMTGFRERLAVERRMDGAAGRSLFGPHRSDLEAVYKAKGVAARHCSTGEQKALLVSLVLATARAAKARTGRTPTLLLDEVAAHFDPDRRAALAGEILKLGAQAFLTGAEAALFDAFGDAVQRLPLGPRGAPE